MANEQPNLEKQEYLVVYDYGMGGLWAYLAAASANDIISRFPQLRIMDRKPETVAGDEQFNRLIEDNRCDMSDPSGWPLWLRSLEGQSAG